MPKEQESRSTLDTILDAADSAEHEPDRRIRSQIQEGLASVVRAVRETGENGSVVLTVKVEPGAEARVNVTAKVKVTCPRAAVPPVTLYTDEEGGLSRAQMGLFANITRSTTQEN